MCRQFAVRFMSKGCVASCTAKDHDLQQYTNQLNIPKDDNGRLLLVCPDRGIHPESCRAESENKPQRYLPIYSPCSNHLKTPAEALVAHYHAIINQHCLAGLPGAWRPDETLLNLVKNIPATRWAATKRAQQQLWGDALSSNDLNLLLRDHLGTSPWISRPRKQLESDLEHAARLFVGVKLTNGSAPSKSVLNWFLDKSKQPEAQGQPELFANWPEPESSSSKHTRDASPSSPAEHNPGPSEFKPTTKRAKVGSHGDSSATQSSVNPRIMSETPPAGNIQLQHPDTIKTGHTERGETTTPSPAHTDQLVEYSKALKQQIQKAAPSGSSASLALPVNPSLRPRSKFASDGTIDPSLLQRRQTESPGSAPVPQYHEQQPEKDGAQMDAMRIYSNSHAPSIAWFSEPGTPPGSGSDNSV
ncbi:hypothetical protein QBC44DRAFT_397047 [Cladorrhinum sp. PSN332]|nr:hypothetical protein QBC44DRAFT_397047 [Cladorrhinum sp. PSN332]